MFSDSHISEVIAGYRRSGRLGRAKVWLSVTLALAVATFTLWGVFWILSSAWDFKDPASLHPKPPVAHEAEHAPAGPLLYEIQNLHVPIGNRLGDRIRYAQFSLVMECGDAQCMQAMQLSRAVVRDSVFTTALQMNAEEFATGRGLASLKKTLLLDLRQRFSKTPPTGVLIKDWFLR